MSVSRPHPLEQHTSLGHTSSWSLYYEVNRYDNCISSKMKSQTAQISLKRKSLRNTRFQPRSFVPKTRLFLLLLAVAASKWVLLSNRWMSQIMSHHVRLLLMGMFPLCLVVIFAPDRAVPGGSGGHGGRPGGKGLRPGSTIPNAVHKGSRLLRGFLS